MSTETDAERAAERAADQAWKDAVWRRIVEMSRQRLAFTAEEIVLAVKMDGFTTRNTSAAGALIRRALKRRMIVPIGFELSKNRQAHGRPVRVYVGALNLD